MYALCFTISIFDGRNGSPASACVTVYRRSDGRTAVFFSRPRRLTEISDLAGLMRRLVNLT